MSGYKVVVDEVFAVQIVIYTAYLSASSEPLRFGLPRWPTGKLRIKVELKENGINDETSVRQEEKDDDTMPEILGIYA